MKRRKLGVETRRLLTNRFNDRCVFCTNRLGTQIHHVNEDPRDNTLLNLIPVCANVNQGIEDLRRQRVRSDGSGGPILLEGEFEASGERSLLKGDELHRAGLYYRAWACFTIGSYVARRYERKPDLACRLASRAFYAARPVMTGDLACVTLERTVIESLKAFHAAGRGVPTELQVQLSREIGAFLHGEKKYLQSEGWLQQAIEMGQIVKRPSDLILEALARATQHRGFNAMMSGSPEGLKLLEEAHRRLLAVNFATGPLNNIQHAVAFHLRTGKGQLAMNEIELLQATLPRAYKLLRDLQVDTLRQMVGAWLACGLAGMVADTWIRDGQVKKGEDLAQACWDILRTTDAIYHGPIESNAVARIAHASGRTIFASGVREKDWPAVNERLDLVRRVILADHSS